MIVAASLCSGIGAPEVAMPGWRWAWCAEVEPFPSAVLAQRHGHPNLGDISAPDFATRAIAAGIPDVLVAGTPCQAFSVAGRREGLADPRGNLTLIALRILEALDDATRSAGRPPVTFVWENVPGALSDKTNAFGCLLAELVGHDTPLFPPGRRGWGNAGMVAGPARRACWRVLDAQYFGLAQRRARVFVVASAAGGPDPAEVLLERAGLRRNPPSRGEARQDASGGVRRGAAGGGGRGGDDRAQRRPDDVRAAVTEFLPQSSRVYLPGQPAPALQATGSRLGQRAPQVLAPAQPPFAFKPSHFTRGKDGAPTTLYPPLSADADKGDQDPVLCAPVAFGGNNTSGPIKVAPALLAQPGSGWKGDFDSETFIAEAASIHGTQDPTVLRDLAHHLGRNDGQENAICLPIAETGKRTGTSSTSRKAGDGIGEDGDPMFTLGADSRHGVAAQAVNLEHALAPHGSAALDDTVAALTSSEAKGHTALLLPPAVAFQDRFRGDDGRGYSRPPPTSEEVCGTLETVKHWNIAAPVAPTLQASGKAAGSTTQQDAENGMPIAFGAKDGDPRASLDIAPTLRAMAEQEGHANGGGQIAVACGWVVRRITPTEAERLQGFPDDFTLIEHRGKPAADGPRHRALGNSMAVPVMRWILSRLDATLAARRDGTLPP